MPALTSPDTIPETGTITLDEPEVYDPGPVTHIVLRQFGSPPGPGAKALCGYRVKGYPAPEVRRHCQECEKIWSNLPDFIKGNTRDRG